MKNIRVASVQFEHASNDKRANLSKIKNAGFDRIVLLATCPAAVAACQKAVDSAKQGQLPQIEQLAWFDVG